MQFIINLVKASNSSHIICANYILHYIFFLEGKLEKIKILTSHYWILQELNLVALESMEEYSPLCVCIYIYSTFFFR
jgi:hypothetical protein